jgi:hypothetical protein
MTGDEAKKVMEAINTGWPGKPIEEIAARIWMSKFMKHDARAVMRVVSRLIESEKWRPSLAQILEPLLVKPVVKTAAAAFESVCEQIGRRPRVVTELEERAVRRLGGWGALGQWQLEERHWHAKRFVEVYDELVAGARSEDMRAIASGERRAIEAGGHGDEKARERIATQMDELRRGGT